MSPLRMHLTRNASRLPPIIKLALRLLRVSTNSASCERLFSAFGGMLTKLRSRLGVDIMQDLVELKTSIRNEHITDGRAKDRLKRHFEPPQTSAGAQI
jgi:hypothetical protein